MSLNRPLLFSALLLALPGALAAQRVVADIAIGQGPVQGHIIIGDRYHPRPDYRYHSGRTVIVYRTHRGHGWYRRHGYRAIRVWYDPAYDRYYERRDGYRRGLREVMLYERDGRYYRDDWRDDRRRRVSDRDHDRWDDDWNHDRREDRHEDRR